MVFIQIEVPEYYCLINSNLELLFESRPIIVRLRSANNQFNIKLAHLFAFHHSMSATWVLEETRYGTRPGYLNSDQVPGAKMWQMQGRNIRKYETPQIIYTDNSKSDSGEAELCCCI